MSSISDALRIYDHDPKASRGMYGYDAVAWASTKDAVSSKVSGNAIVLETEIALENLGLGPTKDTRENSGDTQEQKISDLV